MLHKQKRSGIFFGSEYIIHQDINNHAIMIVFEI